MDTRVKQTTSHRTIRSWVEARGGYPAVAGEGDDESAAALRVVLPDGEGGERVQRIQWRDFFARFDAAGLAFVYQQATSEDRPSTFAQIVRRDEVPPAARQRAGAARADTRAPRAGVSARARVGRSTTKRAPAALEAPLVDEHPILERSAAEAEAGTAGLLLPGAEPGEALTLEPAAPYLAAGESADSPALVLPDGAVPPITPLEARERLVAGTAAAQRLRADDLVVLANGDATPTAATDTMVAGSVDGAASAASLADTPSDAGESAAGAEEPRGHNPLRRVAVLALVGALRLGYLLGAVRGRGEPATRPAA